MPSAVTIAGAPVTAISSKAFITSQRGMFPCFFGGFVSRLRASISYSRQPKAHRSARRSALFPRACSGLMYAAVPMIIPASVPAEVIVGECAGSPVELRLWDHMQHIWVLCAPILDEGEAAFDHIADFVEAQRHRRDSRGGSEDPELAEREREPVLTQ